MTTKPQTDDLSEMLKKMQQAANQKLSEIDSEIAATHKKINALRKVGYTDCFNMICEKLKMQRDSDLKDLDLSMSVSGVLSGHASLSRFNLHGDGSSSISEPSKHSFDMYSLSKKNIDRAMLTDAQIEAYAKAASKRFECLETTPSAANLAAENELAVLKLKSLHDQKFELNRRVASLMFVESEAQKTAPTPGQPDPTKPIHFNDGTWKLMPERPNAQKITLNGEPI